MTTGDNLITWLRAILAAAEQATIRYRDGHPGPCLNMPGQDPDTYDEHDSCYLHIADAEATPYRDVPFGLADIDAKRRIIDAFERARDDGASAFQTEREHGRTDALAEAVEWLAVPYADRPGYRQEWTP